MLWTIDRIQASSHWLKYDFNKKVIRTCLEEPCFSPYKVLYSFIIGKGYACVCSCLIRKGFKLESAKLLIKPAPFNKNQGIKTKNQSPDVQITLLCRCEMCLRQLSDLLQISLKWEDIKMFSSQRIQF